MFRMETVTLQVLISLPQYKCNEAKHTFIGSTNANVMKWNVITSNYRTICLDFGLFCQAEFLKCLIFSLYGGFMYIKDPRLSFIKFYNTESEAMVWKKSTKPLNIQRFFKNLSPIHSRWWKAYSHPLCFFSWLEDGLHHCSYQSWKPQHSWCQSKFDKWVRGALLQPVCHHNCDKHATDLKRGNLLSLCLCPCDRERSPARHVRTF